MQRVLVIAGTALVLGCPSPRPVAPHRADDRALRLRVAQDEARRADGVADLVELAQSPDPHARALALRGLGRIGGATAARVLGDGLGDPDPAVGDAAAGAIGVAAALDEHVEPALVAALARAPARPAMLEALGLAGDPGVLPRLVAALGGSDDSAEAAARALARLGRRDIALTAEARAALVTASRRAASAVRRAATAALAREHDPPADDAVTAALVARIADDDPEIRAVAIAGLARRKSVDAGRAAIVQALADRDWRVACEAVRALAGDGAGRAAIAAMLPQRMAALVAGDARAAHVVLEALRQLQAGGKDPAVMPALGSIVPAAQNPRVPPLARGWIDCLAIAAAQRASATTDYVAVEGCGGGELPDFLRLPLVADLVTAAAGTIAARREAVHVLLAHADARVRAAGLGALPALWPDGDDADHRTMVAEIAAALGSRDVVLAGAAVDAATALYAAVAKTPGDTSDRATLDAAVVARAARERDPELASALDELVGKQQLAAGDAACRAGLTGAPVQARAAAECLRALGDGVPVPAIAGATPPPVDVAAVIGRDVRWHLVTTRGEIVIALAPEVAPWNVATVVTLTRRGFYDGLVFHRVVPGFVVQGGDPTGSGAGGPGFTTPAEPAAPEDHAPFATGAVGIADAGRDTGGSQFFVMHAAAPHLDGRYTWIGRVVAGQDAADALLIGDRIVRATVEVR